LAKRHGCVEMCAFLGRSEEAIVEVWVIPKLQCVLVVQRQLVGGGGGNGGVGVGVQIAIAPHTLADNDSLARAPPRTKRPIFGHPHEA
jgi:hypothetical protein